MTEKARSACYLELREIAYQSACESLAQQRADLRSLRSQASILAALSGLIAATMSRLATMSLEKEHLNLFDLGNPVFIGMTISVVLAILSLLGTVVLTLLVLVPSAGWRFEDSPKMMLEKLSHKGDEFLHAHLLEKLALAKEKRFEKNEELLIVVQQRFFWACVLVPVQAFAWIFIFLVEK